MRSLVAVAVLFAVATGGAAAQPAARGCSNDIFTVAGQQVSLTVCAGAVDGSAVAITETAKSGAKASSRAASIEILPGAATSRSVDDLSLEPIGLSYTLHLTLAYRNGTATTEHALLLPGAVPLK
jgi:hypothetical protein